MSAPSRAADASVATSASSPMSTSLVVLVLALLLGIQPVTTDLYLPALPSMVENIGASMAQAQLTLSGLLLAFGVSQLVWGPLSDRFGRRPVLIGGLTLYTVSATASALAPDIEWLVLARVVQGVAMGAAVMGARAVVRDLYQPEAGARTMSRALTGLGVIACLCVPLGALLADWIGWRAALLSLTVFGAASLALLLTRFTETLSRLDPEALDPARLAASWARVLRHPTFLSYTLLSAATYAGLFAFLATSSFVFIRVHGFSRIGYGLIMFASSFSYILGTVLCRQLLRRVGMRRAVGVAAGLTLAGGLLMAAGWLAGLRSAWALILPFLLFMVAHGVHQPCSQSGAVGPFPQAAGVASALNGFAMMVVAFGTGQWLGHHMDGTARIMVQIVAGASIVVALAAWTLVQRHGEPDRDRARDPAGA